MTSCSSALEVTDLIVYRGDELILDRISVNLVKGEFVAVVGKSGCGKTTFLNAVAGFIPSGGEIVTSEKIGYVFQNSALFPWMTVAENIGFALGKGSKKARASIVNGLLRKSDLTALSGRYPGELSGGQVQRVALSRVLAADPELLLMDEPYAALDHYSREQMQNWLLTVWQDTKNTVVFVTHFIEEAIFLADRVIVVSDGSIVEEITVPFDRPRTDELRYSTEVQEIKRTIVNVLN